MERESPYLPLVSVRGGGGGGDNTDKLIYRNADSYFKNKYASTIDRSDLPRTLISTLPSSLSY